MSGFFIDVVATFYKHQRKTEKDSEILSLTLHRLSFQKTRISLDLLAVYLNEVCLQTHQLIESQISQHQSMMFSLMVMPTGQNVAKAEVDVNGAA